MNAAYAGLGRLSVLGRSVPGRPGKGREDSVCLELNPHAPARPRQMLHLVWYPDTTVLGRPWAAKAGNGHDQPCWVAPIGGRSAQGGQHGFVLIDASRLLCRFSPHCHGTRAARPRREKSTTSMVTLSFLVWLRDGAAKAKEWSRGDSVSLKQQSLLPGEAPTAHPPRYRP